MSPRIATCGVCDDDHFPLLTIILQPSPINLLLSDHLYSYGILLFLISFLLIILINININITLLHFQGTNSPSELEDQTVQYTPVRVSCAESLPYAGPGSASMDIVTAVTWYSDRF